MLRVILAISLIILSVLIGYYFLGYSPENNSAARPEISEKKKAAIAKRAEQKSEEFQEDINNEEDVLDLERYYQ